MSSPAPRIVVVDGAAPREVTISSWPLRDEPLSVAIAVIAAAALGIGVGYAAASIVVGIAATAALLAALRNLLLPAQFQLNELGVRQLILGRSRRITWREIADCHVGERGIVLLLADSPQSLLRGVYVPFLQQRDELLTIVEHHLRQADIAA
jgi:hypothetical protein